MPGGVREGCMHWGLPSGGEGCMPGGGGVCLIAGNNNGPYITAIVNGTVNKYDYLKIESKKTNRDP